MDIAILVISWDGYADLWRPFFTSLSRAWPDCPYPLFLGANSLTYPDDRVTPVLIGEEVDYCSNLIAMLRQLDHKWVIPWVEDFLPASPIDSGRIAEIVEYAERHDVDYANLVALPYEINPIFAGPPVVDTLGEMPADAPYRASLGTGLWNRESLLRLLVPGESAWDIERKGTTRSGDMGFRCLCTTVAGRRNPPVKVLNGIERGRWTRKAADFITELGMGDILDARGVEDGRGVWKMAAYSLARYSAIRAVCAVGGRPAQRLLGSIIAGRKLAWQN